MTPVAEMAPARMPALVAAPTRSEAGVLRPLGQLLDGYIVAEGPDGLVLIDQHAAHERILYNRFLVRLATGAGVSQPLLIPLAIELGPEQVAAASDHSADLSALGFEVEDFGPRSLRVLAAPAEMPVGRVAETVEELLSALAGSTDDQAATTAAASVACHAAVRFGDRLDPAEQRRLLEDLEQAENGLTCPHGRPTRLVVEWQDLKRHFRRNY
jgi:DNA mismatch repair protein MutL